MTGPGARRRRGARRRCLAVPSRALRQHQFTDPDDGREGQRHDAVRGGINGTMTRMRALLVAAATAMIVACGQLCDAAAADDQMPQPPGEFGSFHRSPDYSFWGPQRAKGVIVWSHGTPSLGDCPDRQPAAAPAFIVRFNLDGWDILRFDRDPCSDEINRAVAEIATSLPQLQAAGYRRIVLAGQSRGAWHSLAALSVPGLAAYIAGVIGVSPAKHGTKLRYVTETGSYEWKVLVDHLAAPRVSIALIFFPRDQYLP